MSPKSNPNSTPTARAKELDALIRHHNQRYWDANTPEITDLEYDALVRELRAAWPEAPVLSAMGPTVRPASAVPGASEVERLGSEVVHAAPMLSLDKAYSDEELNKWSDKLQGNLLCMPKVDGVACSIRYAANGSLELAATRGDGERGDDITANVRASALVPLVFPGGAAEVRGELYMRRSRFKEAYAEQFANPRNLTAGAIKQKDPRKAAAYKLSFMAYDLRGRGHRLESDKLDALKAAGFEVIPYEVVERAAGATAYLRMSAQRAAWDFEADGVVFKANATEEQERLGNTNHHPRYAMAYKFQGDSGETTLKDVEWGVSRNGTITPVALVEPVPLSGVTVGRASLHHAGFIGKLKLTMGARLLVMRRGDVIPHVEGVVADGPLPVLLPQQCPSCGSPTRLDGDFLFCTTPATCPDALVGVLKHFTTVLDVQGVGEKLLANLLKRQLVKTPADLYRLTREELLTLDRMGETLADKILKNIEARRELELPTFLTALGIDELGPTVAGLLAQHHPSLEALRACTEEQLSTIHGVGPSIARSVVAGLRDRAPLVEALLRYVTLKMPARSLVTDHALSGKGVVFTGTLVRMDRKEAQKRVVALGGRTPSGVTKDLDYLVIGVEKDGAESSKLKSARKLQAAGSSLKVLTEDEFLTLLGSPT